MPCWVPAKTLMANFPRARRWFSVPAQLARDTATIGGGKETDKNELTVQPTGSWSPSVVVTIATPVGKCPAAARSACGEIETVGAVGASGASGDAIVVMAVDLSVSNVDNEGARRVGVSLTLTEISGNSTKIYV